MARIIRCDRCLKEFQAYDEVCYLRLVDRDRVVTWERDLCVPCAGEVRAQFEVPSPAKP